MTHDRAQDTDRQHGQVGRTDNGVAGRSSRSATLTASKVPVASKLEGRDVKDHKEGPETKPARRVTALRTEAEIRAELMRSVEPAGAPVRSLVASVGSTAPAARIQRAKELAAVKVEPTGPAQIGARMRGAVGRVGALREAQPAVAALVDTEIDRVAGSADLPALESAAAPGRPPAARIEAVKATADRQRTAIDAAENHATDRIEDHAAGASDKTAALAAVDDQEVAEQANLEQREQVGAAKIDQQTATSEGAATQGAEKATTGGGAQAAQSHAAAAAKTSAETDANHTAAEQKAKQIRDAAKVAADQARAKGDADAAALRKKGEADAAQARAEATQAPAPQPAGAASSEPAPAPQAHPDGAQRANEILQQAEQAAQAALAAAAKVADDLLAKAEVEAHAVLDAAEKTATASEAKQASDQGSLLASLSASFSEITTKVTSTLSALMSRAVEQKAVLATEKATGVEELQKLTAAERAKIQQAEAVRSQNLGTDTRAIEDHASAATSKVDATEAQLLTGIDAASPEVQRQIRARYGTAATPSAEGEVPTGMMADPAAEYGETLEKRAPSPAAVDTQEVPTGMMSDPAAEYGETLEKRAPVPVAVDEQPVPTGMMDTDVAEDDQQVPTGMMDTEVVATAPATPAAPKERVKPRPKSMVDDARSLFGGEPAQAPVEERPKVDPAAAAQVTSALAGVSAKDYEATIAKLPPEQQVAARALEAEKVEEIAKVADKVVSGDLDLEYGIMGPRDRLKTELKALPPAMREAVIAKIDTSEDGVPTQSQFAATGLLTDIAAEEKFEAGRGERKAKAIENGVAATEAAVKAGSPKAVTAALDKLSPDTREEMLAKLSPDARAMADEQLQLRKERLAKAAGTLLAGDKIAVIKTMGSLTPNEASELEDMYNDVDLPGGKRNLRADLDSKFDEGSDERKFCKAVIRGDEDAKDLGIDLTVKYIEGETSAIFDSSESGINDLLRVHADDPDAMNRIANAYQHKTGKDLTSQLEKIMNDEELAESTAYLDSDKARANVAVLEQKDGDRSMMVVDEAKEKGELDKLVVDTETQSGEKASSLLEDAVSKDEMGAIKGEIDEAQAKAKAKIDDTLNTAKDKLAEDPQKYAEAVKKMTATASKLHASLSSTGIGNDFETTDLLRGLSPAEIAILKEQYAAGDYGDLDKVVDTKLDGKDRKAAKALLTGNKVQGALALVEQSADGTGTNVEAWKAAMETLTAPEDRAAFAAECKKQGLDYTKLNKSENSGYDRDMAAAQTIVDQDERDSSVAAVKAEKAAYGGKINTFNMAMDDEIGDAIGRSDEARIEGRKEARRTNLLTQFSNLGTDDAALLDAEEGVTTPRARELLDQKLRASTGKGVLEINAEETSGHTKKALDLYAQGDTEGGQVMRMIAAGEGIIDDDEDGMSKGFEGKDDETRKRMEKRMDAELYATGHVGLEQWQKKELTDAQLEVAQDRVHKGKVDDVAAMALAGDTTLGLGHDGGKMKELCAGKSPAEMDQYAKDFAAAGHGDLYAFMRDKASSVGEKRDVEILIGGNYAAMPPAELEKMATEKPGKLIDRIKALHEAAKGGMGTFDIGNAAGNAMTDLYSDQGKILEKRLASVTAMEEKLTNGGSLTDEEQAELIKNVKFMSGDQSAFTDNKNKVVNAGADVVGKVVEVGVAIGTGSDQAGTLAGGLASIMTKANMNGARYSTDEIVQDVGKLGVQLLVGEVMDSKAVGSVLKNPLAKEILSGALEGGLTAGIDTKAMGDLGQLITAIGTGGEQGALSALGAHLTNGLTGGKTFDSKTAAKLHGLVAGLASASVDSALSFDPDAPMLDQAASLLKSMLVEGAKGGHKGGKEHDERLEAEAKARATGTTTTTPTETETETPKSTTTSTETVDGDAKPPAPNRFGDESVNVQGKREVSATTPDGNVTAKLASDKLVVRYPAGMTDVAQRKAFAIDAAAKLGITLHPDSLDQVGTSGAVALPRKLEIRSEADVQAAARSLYDMARAHGDEADLPNVEETLRNALDPHRDPADVPFEGECLAMSKQWQGALAERGIFAPVMKAGKGPERDVAHNFIVVGNTIIDPTIGQFASGTVAEGRQNQYEPFIGTYPQMLARVQAQIDAGQMPGYASAADALSKGWGIKADPTGNGFKLDDSVQPLKADNVIVPTSVDEVRRLMDEQRAHGMPVGRGLPPDLVAEAGGAGDGDPPRSSKPPPSADVSGEDPNSIANVQKRHEERVAAQAKRVALDNPNLTEKQAIERARCTVVNDEVQAGLPEGMTVDRSNEHHNSDEITDIAPMAAQHEDAVAAEAKAIKKANPNMMDDEVAQKARQKVLDDEIKLGESPADRDASRLRDAGDAIINLVGVVSAPVANAFKLLKQLGKADPADKSSMSNAAVKLTLTLVELGLKALLPHGMADGLSDGNNYIKDGLKLVGDHLTGRVPQVGDALARFTQAAARLANVPLDLLAQLHGMTIDLPSDTDAIDRLHYRASIAERAAYLRAIGWSSEQALAQARDEVVATAQFGKAMADAKKQDGAPPDRVRIAEPPAEPASPNTTDADAEDEALADDEALEDEARQADERRRREQVR